MQLCVAGATGPARSASPLLTPAGDAPQDPQGTSLLQAAQAGQVRVTVTSWQPLGQPVQSSTDEPSQLPDAPEGDSGPWLPGLILASMIL